jgi:hypothetical protein
MEPIDVALTFDVERDETIREVMPRIATTFERHDAVGTWFLKHDYTNRFTDYTGRVVEDFPNVVEQLVSVGEIATHIHFRDVDGTFTMDPEIQRDLLTAATESLRDHGYTATSFRGGNLCADATTLQILEDLEYDADSSVLSGHYRELPDDVVVDHRGDAGNRPYVPSRNSHVTAGNLDLTEVPVSGLIPLETLSLGRSLTGIYNRVAPMKPLNRLLLLLFTLWGLTSGAPIVLLFHDHEFALDDGSLAALETFVGAVAESPRFRFATIRQIGKA